MKREADDAERKIQVQSILSGLKVNGDVMKALIARSDITPNRINAEIADIRRDKNVDEENVARVLVSRLR